MAVQNILLLAHKEGLGTCVLGRVEKVHDDLMKIIGTTDLEFMCGVALGYADRDSPVPPRREDRSRVVYS